MGRVLVQQPGTNTAKALTETLPKNVIIVDEDLHQLRLHDGVTPGGHIIGGGGGISNIDELTITENADQEIQAVATVNQNTATGATNPVYDWVGTLAEYQAQNIETLHPDWICYITDDVSGGDSVYTKSQVDEKFQEKATAVNDNNITNCLTHIPQDIKLELNNGTLTLKAGSKVYMPNGAGVFNVITIASDLTKTTNVGGIVFVNSTGTNIYTELLNSVYSGNSAPSSSGIWYDTANNLVKYSSDGQTWSGQYSFPVGIVSTSGGQITSIDQVFNGVGYIGSTEFALPGVKGLISDGRNADGSLKNIAFTVSSVLTHTGGYNDKPQWIVLSSNSIAPFDSVDWIGYNIQENILFNKEGSSSATGGSKISGCVCAFLSANENQKITAFTSKTAFHAVDYSDGEYMAHQAMPSVRYIDLTLGASRSSYKAPADGYVSIMGSASGSDSYIVIVNKKLYATGRETSIGFGVRAWLPVNKGDNFRVEYNQYSNQSFRFIYAQGSK